MFYGGLFFVKRRDAIMISNKCFTRNIVAGRKYILWNTVNMDQNGKHEILILDCPIFVVAIWTVNKYLLGTLNV